VVSPRSLQRTPARLNERGLERRGSDLSWEKVANLSKITYASSLLSPNRTYHSSGVKGHIPNPSDLDLKKRLEGRNGVVLYLRGFVKQLNIVGVVRSSSASG